MTHPLDKARVWELHTSLGRQPFVRIKCDDCPKTEEMTCQVNLPPHFVANKFRHRGWTVVGEGRKARCPNCSRGNRTPGRVVSVVATPVLSVEGAAQLAKEIDMNAQDPMYSKAQKLLEEVLACGRWTRNEVSEIANISHGTLSRLHKGERVARSSTLQHIITSLTAMKGSPVQFKKATESEPVKEELTMTTVQSREALKKQRQVFSLLEDHYIEDQHRYADDWSDERVATETGMSVDFVVTTRETAFGTLDDPKLALLEHRINEAEKKLIKERDELATLFTSMLEDIGNTLKECKADLEALRGERKV